MSDCFITHLDFLKPISDRCLCACKSRWNNASCNADCISQCFLWASVLHCCRINAYKVTGLNFIPCLLESLTSQFFMIVSPLALGLCLLPRLPVQKGRTSQRTCWKSWFTENFWDQHYKSKIWIPQGCHFGNCHLETQPRCSWCIWPGAECRAMTPAAKVLSTRLQSLGMRVWDFDDGQNMLCVLHANGWKPQFTKLRNPS